MCVARRGYQVIEVYKDIRVSGALLRRRDFKSIGDFR